MYLSRLVVSNYRSIKYLDLRFSPTKNILIGHNNAGKSNIIRAVNIILSEQQPDYKRYENITERDFYNNEVKELYIVGFISKKDGESFEFNDFSLTRKGIYITPIDANLERFELFIEECAKIKGDLDRFDYHRGDWKSLQPQRKKFLKAAEGDKYELISFLQEVKNFIYIFKANLSDDGSIEKDFYLTFNTPHGIFLASNTFIRGELIVSAIIPAFRDPNLHLKPSSWSWFGKLMKNKLEEAKEKLCNAGDNTDNTEQTEDPFKDIYEAQQRIRDSANKIFSDIIEDIKEKSLTIGFGGADISFSFSGDELELYKGVRIFVDDGINSPLEDKGAGIQSSVLISLFSYYVKHYQSQSYALLCFEEPEIYLHPHACRVLSNQINNFINDGNKEHQVILTTHNPVFIKSDNQGRGKIFKVYKDQAQGTQIKEVEFNTEFRNLFVRDENLELFFAKKVIVTEGFERFIIRFLADYYYPDKLDLANISVISAEGKDDFAKFIDICERLSIEPYIVADFDFFLRGLENIYNFLQKRLSKEDFRRLQKLRGRLASHYGSFKKEGKKLSDFPIRENSGEDIRIKNFIKEALSRFYNIGVFILDGEMEDMIVDASILETTKDGIKITSNSIVKIRQKLFEENESPEGIFRQEFLEKLKAFIEIVCGIGI